MPGSALSAERGLTVLACPCGLDSQMLDQPNKLQSVVMNQQHGQVCVCSICPLLVPVVLRVFLFTAPQCER